MGLLDRFRKIASTHDELSWPQLTARAMDALRVQTAGHDRAWGLASADWSVDMVEGTITFTGADVVATAPVQIVGTRAADGSWLWGWDHPSVREGLDQHAARVRAYGERHRLDALTTRTISVSEDEAWEYVAVAALLNDAQGAYRGPSSDNEVFMTFGTVSLAGPGASNQPIPSQHAPVVPVPGNDTPELIGPAEGLPTPQTSPHLSGSEPELNGDEVIDFVRGYFHEMHPTYHVERGEEADEDEKDRLVAEQDTIRDRYWRRNDSFFEGGVRSTDGAYNLAAIRDWSARRIAPRLWQVSWANDHLLTTRYEGLLVMAFDDGLRIVDALYDSSG